MRDELRRMALVGSGLVELTRYRAEQIVKDLVRSGDVRREQTSTLVRELMERSQRTRQELAEFVRSEIRSQVETLGVASARDVERLERRVARLEERTKPSKTTTSKKTTRKKTAATKKTTASGG
jgi:polyhydroxyalkanoate synthesis regulator phasin